MFTCKIVKVIDVLAEEAGGADTLGKEIVVTAKDLSKQITVRVNVSTENKCLSEQNHK